MSSTIQKITDKLTGKNKEHDDPHSSNYGPHSSAAANKADPRIDSDFDGRNNPTAHTGGYGHTQTAGTHGTAGGAAIGDSHNMAGNPTYVENTHSANAGPHSSNLANKLDPRVDSDRDGRNNPASHVGGYGGTQTTDTYGGTGVGGTHQSTTAGPHSSNLANKLDPRVDSDLDGSNKLGSSQTGHGYAQNTTTTTAGHTTGLGSTTTHHTGTTGHSSNVGPHSSNLANKLDPRVDADRDGRANPLSHTGDYGSSQAGAHQGTHTGTQAYTGSGSTLGNTQSANAGPHSNNLLNKLDPRVDSDRDGSNNPASHTGGYGHTQPSSGHIGSNTRGYGNDAGMHGTGAGVGSQGYTGTNDAHNNPKSTNTGPHSSNLLNKLDPRVDSDHDGRNDPTSKTGGYGQTQTGTGGVGRY